NGAINAEVLGQGQSDNPYYLTAWETNPFNSDSDEDGVPDGIDSRVDPEETSEPVYWKWDTDDDGLINAMDSDSDNDEEEDDEDTTPLGIIGLNPGGDLDSDGLTNGEEWEIGCQDNDTDSDDDGLTDYQEVITYGCNPMDKTTDSDSYEDKYEVDHGLYPNSSDTDNDGLLDDDPYEGIQDTDTDGIINAKDLDSDNDGIRDEDEVKIHYSDPTDSDCDDDYLLDGEELIYKTDIFSKYTDSDGWTDYYEVKTSLTDPNLPDSDYDGANDDVDFCHVENAEIMFSIREFISIDKGDSDGKPDPYLVACAYSSKDDISSPKQYDDINWKGENILKYYHTSEGTLTGGEHYLVSGISECNRHPTDPKKAEHPEKYEFDDDFGEKWIHDGTKTRNEMKYKFSFCTKNLENDARLVRFIIMIYDDDADDDDLFDISPVTNKYGEKPNNEKFWENFLLFPNDCIEGKALDIIYDTHTSLWYVMDSTGRIVEGWNYSIDSGNLNIHYDQCGTSNGDPSWGGYCSGDEDNGVNKGGSMNAAISFDIFPFNTSTYSVYNSSHYFEPGDYDHDKLTEMSELLYYHTNITNDNTDEFFGGEADYFNDWWEIRYEMDPLDNLDLESGSYDWKGARDSEEDGLIYANEYKYFEWGANPYVKDIFVEVDWMEELKLNVLKTITYTLIYRYYFPVFDYIKYNFKEGSQNMVIRTFINHDICLHIDDGCMGGGKGNIPHQKYCDDEEKYQGDTKYFDSDRKGVFYYCVLCDEYGKRGDTAEGHGWGDSFLIGAGDSGSHLDNNFMHELGHCIIERIDNGSDPSHPDHTSTDSDDNFQWAHCDNDCNMYWNYNGGERYRWSFKNRPLDFCSHCWNELSRDGIGMGTVL
ncbi:MAG: hypothetical protein JXA22_07960, partial [Candidatus Thermoplasmatota archaeon]|nr:hypothetical protein [Candidatus Thermoplasmatota archaeon]